MLQGPDSTEIYRELQKIAAIHLSRSSVEASIQPTQLVNEAWLRLHDRGWKSRTHFLALASRTMRMVLIDAVRARMAEKRQGGWSRITLTPNLDLSGPALSIESVIELDSALNLLAEKDERKARVVEMRFFGGLAFKEIAGALAISEVTAKRDWEFARTWLFARLSGQNGSSGE